MINRTASLIGIAALVLATGTAHASNYLIPPAEYDYLFPGPIVITRKDDLTGICLHDPGLIILGCGGRREYICQVYLLTDEQLDGWGIPYEVALRHEIAHCNGWGKDHAGGRRLQELGEAPVEGANAPYELNPEMTYYGQAAIGRFLDYGFRRLKEMGGDDYNK